MLVSLIRKGGSIWLQTSSRRIIYKAGGTKVNTRRVDGREIGVIIDQRWIPNGTVMLLLFHARCKC